MTDPARPAPASAAALRASTGAGGSSTALLPEAGLGFSALTLMMLAFIIPNPIALTIGGVVFTPLRIMLILSVVPVLLAFSSRRTGRLYAFDLWFLAFALWSAMCILKNQGLGGIEFMGQFLLEFVILYFLVQFSISSVANLTSIVSLMFWMVFFLLILAIPEAVFRVHFTMNAANAIVGLPPIEPLPHYVRLGLQRAMTVFNHPILYGVFCAAILGFAWELTRSLAGRLFRLAVISAATFLSLSSAPILVLIVQVILMIGERTTRGVKKRGIIAVSVVAAAVFAMEAFTGRGAIGFLSLITLEGGTAYYRQLIWHFGIDDVLRHPIFGFYAPLWTRPSWMGVTVDNYWLLLAMRGGIPSVLFLALALLSIGRHLYRRPDEELSDVLVRLRRAWAFAIIALLLSGGTVAFFDKLQPFFAMMIGLGGVIVRLIAASEHARGDNGGVTAEASPSRQAPKSARPRPRTVL